jgi:HEPN domain-containing protein
MKGRRRQRVFGVPDGFTGQELVESARDHMRSAILLFETDPYCFDSAGYLAHLSIELLFKALLLAIRGAFPARHDLRRLFALVEQEVPGTSLTEQGVQALDLINGFGGLRYPNPRQPIEVGNDELDLIVSLYNNILSYIPADMRPAQDPQGLVTKHGRILMRKSTSKGTPPNRALEPTAPKKRRRRRGSMPGR